MRKEAEEAESPKRSIRDSGYIDCWDSERSDSLSPPRHGREDSFDSLDSFGSRSRQTPSPDVLVARGSSDGRGSDSESDGPPHRKAPDIRKDDMSARRTSVSELRTAMPFNQYLPNKSNQTGYVPTPLRKKKNDKEDGARKSWSTATSPVGGDRPLSPDEVRSLDTPSPSSPPPLEPQTQIHREDQGPRAVSIPSIEIHAASRRRSSDPPPCSVPQPRPDPPAETVTHLMGAAAQSTPARSCSEELFHRSTAPAGNAVAASVVKTTGPGKHSPAADREEAGGSKGLAGTPLVAEACQTLTSPKRTASPSHLLPVTAAMATTSKEIANTGRRKGRTLSESDDPQGSWFHGNLPATFSHTDIVSDDSQSVSMIDMRGEDDGVLQPHSQVRHELMHNQYNMMKEEDDHWQDDLARWKNRRRSVSQDLIKKEEERKMMENLLTGDECPAMRRRSIKTYREIVEEKERREEDLRDTYRRARTPEEASVILQRYAQRFSISETILERLQLPKLLDRSISADPSLACSPFPLSLSSSPTTPDPFDADPSGPLRFLRQQSAPAPKFTSTLEARIEEFPKDLSSSPHQRPQIRSRSSEPPTTRALSPKPVPLLSPKPYLESRGRAAEPGANKADGLLRVNGNAGSDAPTAPESLGRESPPHFQASPSRTSSSTVAAPCSAASPAHSPHAPPTGGSPASVKAKEAQGGIEAASEDVREQREAEHSSPLSRPTSLPAELQKPEESFWKTGDQTAAAPEEKTSTAAAQPTTRTEAKQEVKPEASGPNVATLVQSGLSTQQCHAVTLQASFPSSQEFPQGGENVPNLTAPGSSGYHLEQEMTAEFANSVLSPAATSNPKLRLEFFAPPEAPGQDLRGNEKYRREQEKLKEEWEKAQREVAEEERKFHEEERRILEETVAPLTPRSSALPSPSRGGVPSTAEPHDTIVRSLADWERKQELLERQSRGSMESVEGKRRENDRTSDISTADDSMKTGRSLVSHSSSQQETLGHSLQNGQKPPASSLKPSTPVKKQEDLTTDGNKAGQSAGDRRGGPIDNNTSRSSSNPPEACPPPPDTLPPAPNRSVSGKKLCSSCGQPLGKGAAMIIETLSLYFHITCFKCGVCKGQLGDTTTGTDVRIRNGLLNCHQCYIRSRSAGQPTTL
ncbi:LIM and calponin homology domains-containing protein 1-like [Limanda limanda]|uniref:LIM and calponin homology domains-containing protein 1-like n=1 Tax=Limanda limanda TaxID=27771 RepID=UPI0029C8F5A5|nr:LIM and calponin homology domains-containing protein 1-like [Limanda limanda]